MVIELILAEDTTIAKSGDAVILKDDGTFEVKKADKPFESDSTHEDDKLEKNVNLKNDKYKKTPDSSKFDPEDKYEIYGRNPKYEKDTKKEYDPRIEKYISIDKEKSWALLTKFYANGHLDSYQILKDFLNKVATCPDVTDKFEKIMDDWMRDGEADVSTVEKIISSCKHEGGNVEKELADWNLEAAEEKEQQRELRERKKEKKKPPIEKAVKIIEEVIKEKNKPDRDTKWVDRMVESGDLPKQKPGFPKPKTRKV